eukprot:PhM_4_TR18250/c0_g1_i1/m.1129/K01724/PCBD, phhB; 4a-hydroxytetrahydrobiopterin dehydratase
MLHRTVLRRCGPPQIPRDKVATLVSANWALQPKRDAIECNYTFSDFNTCWAFMNAVAPKLVAMDHHPEWFNVYSKLHVVLATHTCNGVSQNDVELAKYMDDMYEKFNVKK